MTGPSPRTADRDRGQAYVLGAIAAGLVMLSAVVFAIQATAVTPLSVSTASQHVENQERELADTVLSQTAENGTLRAAVLYWDADNRTFVNASARGYLGRTPDNGFGRQLGRVFSDQQIAVNVVVSFGRSGGALGARRLVYQGAPSDNAVSASRTLVLMDDDHLRGPDADRTLNGTDPTPSFYAPDIAPNGTVYNVVEVRIVAWRM